MKRATGVRNSGSLRNLTSDFPGLAVLLGLHCERRIQSGCCSDRHAFDKENGRATYRGRCSKPRVLKPDCDRPPGIATHVTIGYIMTSVTIRILSILLAVWSCGSVPTNAQTNDDPCAQMKSNIDMRDCYAQEQARNGREADALANTIAADLIKRSHDRRIGLAASDLLRKAAAELRLAQTTWKAYRDQHCRAVMYSWTTGSGAGTAYQSCLFNLGNTRLQALRSDFASAAK